MVNVAMRALRAGERIRVLVVDDSVVIRRLVCHALEEDPGLEVAGVASNGVLGLKRLEELNPDVVTLDIEMPEMDGLEMLRRMRGLYPHTRVIMFSTLTGRGAAATLDALALGAQDYITKASNAGSLDVSLAALRQELIPKIRQFFHTPSKIVVPAPRLAVPAPRKRAAQAVGIAVSTGGPTALAAVLPSLPADLPVPVFLVQHMPPLFTHLLAERLQATCKVRVVESAGGEAPVAGTVYVAPGDYHLTVAGSGGGVRTRLTQGPRENSCRPSADVLFDSLAEVYGGGVLGVVMTGMGKDGLRGAERLHACGSSVIVQDEATSVVWGMPGSVAGAGIADQIVPLDGIAETIRRRL